MMKAGIFFRYLWVSTLSLATMISLFWTEIGPWSPLIFVLSFIISVFCYVPMIIIGLLTIHHIARIPYERAASFALFVLSQYLTGLLELLLMDRFFFGEWTLTHSILHLFCAASFLLGMLSIRKNYYLYQSSLHEQYLV